MENQVNFEFFSKKDDNDSVGQSSIGILNLVMKVIQLAYPYQMTEGVNPFLPKPISPNKASNLVTVSQGVIAGYSSGVFQIEGLSPRKMAKTREVLKSLDIKVYSRRKSRCSTGL